ncbi:hypothetical protein GCM10023263_03750 [Phytohabitans rumicis]
MEQVTVKSCGTRALDAVAAAVRASRKRAADSSCRYGSEWRLASAFPQDGHRSVALATW